MTLDTPCSRELRTPCAPVSRSLDRAPGSPRSAFMQITKGGISPCFRAPSWQRLPSPPEAPHQATLQHSWAPGTPHPRCAGGSVHLPLLRNSCLVLVLGPVWGCPWPESLGHIHSRTGHIHSLGRREIRLIWSRNLCACTSLGPLPETAKPGVRPLQDGAPTQTDLPPESPVSGLGSGISPGSGSGADRHWGATGAENRGACQAQALAVMREDLLRGPHVGPGEADLQRSPLLRGLTFPGGGVAERVPRCHGAQGFLGKESPNVQC